MSFLRLHNIKITVLIHGRQVAGIEPAVAQGAGRLVGPPPVAAHDLGPLDDQFPHLAGGQGQGAAFHIHNAGVGAGQGHADGIFFLALVSQGVDMGNGRGFGQPVAFQNGGAGSLLKAAENFTRQRGRAGNADSECCADCSGPDPFVARAKCRRTARPEKSWAYGGR